MWKRCAVLLLTACLLAGCVSYTPQPVWPAPVFTPAPDAAPHMPAPQAPQQNGPPTQAPGTGDTFRQTYGSAGLLGWPGVLVSLYVDEANGSAWTPEAIEQTRQTLALSVAWLEEQRARYGAGGTLRYDDGTPDSGLFYHVTYPGTLAGGADSEEDEDYYTFVETLCAELDSEELHRRCGTSSVGFLVFLPVAGSSFTTVHYQEDGDEYLQEYCTLYRYDAYSAPGTAEGPATYAHEILHLYGAPDLYADSPDFYVTPQLCQFVADTWPDAIMLDVYEPDGSLRYDGISQTLCPLTAYRLGLCALPAELAAYPEVTAVVPGAFTDSAHTAAQYPAQDAGIAA